MPHNAEEGGQCGGPIFLLGFMGCGKTTLGKALHNATGLDFVDLDEAIEARAGMSVREIFSRRGEAAFRRMEREQLRLEAGGHTRTIVACGGGTPCQHGNMSLMNSLGTTVWLQAPVDVLTRRLRLAREQRPLIATLGDTELELFVAETLHRRSPHYAMAHHTFDSSELEDPHQIAAAVSAFTRRFL